MDSEVPAAEQLITISASYGAGGSVVAPALADRLGVPFVSRLTTTENLEGVAGHEHLSRSEAAMTPMSRLLASLTYVMPAGPTQSPVPTWRQDEELRSRAEDKIHALADGGAGVILGRAAAIVLGKSRGYHVRLDGTEAKRISQGASIERISVDEAKKRMSVADRARTAYVRRLYDVDPTNPDFYHLVIDSTAIPLEATIELIVTGARARIVG
jgi:cytidylate kinase